jgi:hypothetical protein
MHLWIFSRRFWISSPRSSSSQLDVASSPPCLQNVQFAFRPRLPTMLCASGAVTRVTESFVVGV